MSLQRANPLSLKKYETSEISRNKAIIAAFASGGYTQKRDKRIFLAALFISQSYFSKRNKSIYLRR